MPFSTPSQISSFVPVTEIIAIEAGGTPFVLTLKAHTGSNRREIEVFTVAEVLSGVPVPDQVQVLNQTFTDVSAVFLSGTTARLYWNDRVPDPVSPVIKQVDYDFATNTAGVIGNLPFFGLDPFVLDARTGSNPSNLVMTYITPGGGNAFRISTNTGLTWGAEQIIDADGAGVTNVEANFDDPQGARQAVQVLQRRI